MTLALGVCLVTSVATGAELSRVTLVTAGDEARARTFEASLRELLSRLQLTLDVRTGVDAGEPEGEALAAVEADFSEPDACKLTVVDWLGRTVLVRRMSRAASVALQAEAAAHVVQSVVEELVALSKWKPPVVEPPPLDAPPLAEAARVEAPVAVAPPGRFGVDLGAFFGGRTFLNGAPVTAGGGAAVSFAVRAGNFRPMLTVLGDYHTPFAVGEPGVTVQLQTVSARALLSLDLLGGDAYRIDFALGGGADVFISNPTSVFHTHPSTDADPIITAAVMGRLAIASSVDLYLALSVDFDTWPITYGAAIGPHGPPDRIYSPFPVRPSLALGFSFNAFGPDPYGGHP